MAALTPPQALPALLGAIASHLEASGQVPESQLNARFAPSSLGRAEDGEAAGGLTLKGTLEMGRSIGAVHSGKAPKKETTVMAPLSEALARSIGAHRALRAMFMHEARDVPDLFTNEASTGARDLLRALTWFVMQDPIGPALAWTATPKEHSVEERQGALPKRLRPFENQTRWQSFMRWTTYLGFARRRRVGRVWGLLPDLYPVFIDLLPAMPQGSRPLTEFLADLAREVPIISGGTVHAAFVGELRNHRRPPVEHAVGQAVLRLEEAGVISLTTVPDYSIANPDAVVSLLEGTPEERRVTHVQVVSEVHGP